MTTTNQPTGLLAQLLTLLITAQAVTIDGGSLLTSWGTDNFQDDPDNEILNFTWTDGENDFSCVLTEGGISEGNFNANGTFVCEDSNGDTTEIKAFILTQLIPEPVTEVIPDAVPQQYVEILQHRVLITWREDDAPEELDESSVEHIEKLIKGGYREGELVTTWSDPEVEHRGWWEIDNQA